jgi:hypothetical protein
VGVVVHVQRDAHLLEIVVVGGSRRFPRNRTAGSSKATRMPMMAMTTSSSTSVKPLRRATWYVSRAVAQRRSAERTPGELLGKKMSPP